MSRDSPSPVVMPERAVLLPSLLEPHDEGSTAAPATDLLPPPATEGSDASPKLNREEYVSCQFQLAAMQCFVTANFTSRVVQTWLLLPTTSVLLAVGLVETGGALLYLLYVLLFTSRRAQFGRLAPRELLLLLAGGVSASTAMLSVFNRFLSVPAGDAWAVFFVTFVVFLSVAAVLVCEPLKRSGFLAAATAFTGLILVPHPDFSFMDLDAFNPSSHDRIIGTTHNLCSALSFCFVYMVMSELIMSVHFMTAVLPLGVTTVILSLGMGGGFQTLSFLLRERSTMIGGAIVALFMFLGLLCLSYSGLNSSYRNKSFSLRHIEFLLMFSLPIVIMKEMHTFAPSIGSPLILILSLGLVFV